VGITRAREELFLTHAYRRTLFGTISNNPPSRFLRDVPPHLFGAVPRSVSSFDPDEGPRKPPEPRKLWVNAPVTPRQEKAAASGANQFKPGQKVQHATFGIGIVVSSKEEGDDVQVSVAFPNVGMKKLMQSIAKLRKV
jgi:DNA helicase-2/ATP-dependent DNA helicase PcrA